MLGPGNTDDSLPLLEAVAIPMSATGGADAWSISDDSLPCVLPQDVLQEAECEIQSEPSWLWGESSGPAVKPYGMSWMRNIWGSKPAAARSLALRCMVPIYQARPLSKRAVNLCMLQSKLSDDTLRIVLMFASNLLVDLLAYSLVDQHFHWLCVSLFEELMDRVVWRSSGQPLPGPAHIQPDLSDILCPHVAKSMVSWQSMEILRSGECCKRSCQDFDVAAAFSHFSDSEVVLHCSDCNVPIVKASDVISRSYRIGAGKAFLTAGAYNVNMADATHQAQYTSGSYTVCHVSCGNCDVNLGVTYVDAHDRTNMYKVGKFLLAQRLLVHPECCQMPARPVQQDQLCYRCSKRSERGIVKALFWMTDGFRNVARTQYLSDLLQARQLLERRHTLPQPGAKAGRAIHAACQAFLQKCLPSARRSSDAVTGPQSNTGPESSTISTTSQSAPERGCSWTFGRPLWCILPVCRWQVRASHDVAYSPSLEVCEDVAVVSSSDAPDQASTSGGLNSATTLERRISIDTVIAHPSAAEAWTQTLVEHVGLMTVCSTFTAEVLRQLQCVNSSSSDGRCSLTYASVLQFVEVLSLAAKSHLDGIGMSGADADLRVELLEKLLPSLLPSCAPRAEVIRGTWALASTVRQRWIVNHVRLPHLSPNQRDTIVAALVRHAGPQEKEHLQRILADGRLDDSTLPWPCSPFLLQSMAEGASASMRTVESL